MFYLCDVVPRLLSAQTPQIQLKDKHASTSTITTIASQANRRKCHPSTAQALGGLPSFKDGDYFLNSINSKSMGCEPSNLNAQLSINRLESLTTEEDMEIGAEKIINRQRGEAHELYHFSKVLWRGRSIVRKVLERNSRIERVCKILTVDKNVSLFQAYQEVEILKKLNHPNIVQIVQYFTQPNFLYIVLQHIPGRSLHELYYQEEIRSLDVIISILRQVLIALKFCHEKGYVHKAVNPEHIMVLRLERSKSFLVKLVGFGRSLRKGAPKLSSKVVSAEPLFIAPEADNDLLTEKQDSWACGIILLEMLTGERKYQNFIERKEVIIRQAIARLTIPEDYKSLMRDFMLKILEVCPEKRLSVDDALNHGIFSVNFGNGAIVQGQASQVIQKLMHFRVQNNLRSLFFIYTSVNILSIEQKSEYLMQFYNLDKNKDGKIDYNELVEAMMNTLEMDQETAVQHVQKIFSLTNRQKELSLSFHDYVAATTLAKKETYERKLVKLFEELDSNKDGSITKEELSKAVEGVHCSKLLENYPKDAITFMEFKQLLMSVFEEKKSLVE